ncbi:MAG: HAMP domain-containing histidine kinase [Pseudomonadota bacterium]|nr:HAMP domain-containing histidine kinase [Pseudomonadota bacterium]
MADNKGSPDFSAVLASSVHDMKNSIALLMQSMEELLKEIGQPELPACRKMTQMLYETRRVSGNLMQLLTLYKMGRRLYPVEIVPCCIYDLFSETAMQVEAQAMLKDVELHVDCSPDLTWFVEKDLIGSAVNNALNNAFRYAGQKIMLRAVKDEGVLVISIEDDGPGYPETLVGEVKEVASGVNFHTGSTGLGLRFAAMVANVHQNKGRCGTVRLENGGAFGGGCFRIILP